MLNLNNYLKAITRQIKTKLDVKHLAIMRDGLRLVFVVKHTSLPSHQSTRPDKRFQFPSSPSEETLLKNTKKKLKSLSDRGPAQHLLALSVRELSMLTYLKKSMPFLQHGFNGP